MDGMVKAAVERMEANADAASNFFYRQTTRVDGNMTSMVEAFSTPSLPSPCVT